LLIEVKIHDLQPESKFFFKQNLSTFCTNIPLFQIRFAMVLT